MDKKTAVTLGIVGIIILVILIGGCVTTSTFNNEASLRTTIEQKQIDNKNQFDNMWKKISQVAQVTEAQKNALMEIFNSYATARTGDGSGGAVMKWVQESCPNVDISTFKNLQNIITSSRDSFTMRQTELLDLKREHDKLLRTFPSNMILSMFGRRSIDVVIVTSTKTAEIFATGKDDDVQVFKK